MTILRFVNTRRNLDFFLTPEGFMTLAVTGDAGKTLVLQSNLARFGIEQLARTGTVALKRGSLLLEVTSSLRSFDEEADDLSPAAVEVLAEQQSASTALWEGKQVPTL